MRRHAESSSDAEPRSGRRLRPSGGKRSYASAAERVAFLFELYQRLTSLLPADKPAGRRRRRAETPR